MKKTIYAILLLLSLLILTSCTNNDEDKPNGNDDPILVESSHKYQYSIHSNFDLKLYTYDDEIKSIKILLLDDEISNDNYYNKDNTIYLKSNYIKSIYKSEEDSNYLHTLETNLGKHEIDLEIHEKDLPYIYTELKVESNLIDDIKFEFEMFDYEFEEVIEKSITDSDYTFNNNVVTIKNNYIKNYFNNNENKTQLMLSILLAASNGDKTLILVIITNNIK